MEHRAKFPVWLHVIGLGPEEMTEPTLEAPPPKQALWNSGGQTFQGARSDSSSCSEGIPPGLGLSRGHHLGEQHWVAGVPVSAGTGQVFNRFFRDIRLQPSPFQTQCPG